MSQDPPKKTASPNSIVDRLFQAEHDFLPRILSTNVNFPKIPIFYPPFLPILELKGQFLEAIAQNQVVIVSAETGSGKSTQIPKMLMEAGLCEKGKIGVTQPRRIAAKSIAEKIALDLNVTLGQEVGYKVRFDKKVSPQSQIEVMTEGVLVEELKRDFYLSAYQALVFDEVHERSTNFDLLVGLVAKILPHRPGFKIVLCSATFHAQKVAEYFSLSPKKNSTEKTEWFFSLAGAKDVKNGKEERSEKKPAPILNLEKRNFPITLSYRPVEFLPHSQSKAFKPSPSPLKKLNLEEEISNLFEQMPKILAEIALEIQSGDILVFLPTSQAIQQIHEDLEGRLEKETWEIFPLFGRMSLKEQHKIFSKNQKRRMVLATNLAETSLTVPDISCVVDSGLARVSKFHSLQQSLPIEKIPQSSIAQRCGRAGRVRAGTAILLYSKEDHFSRPLFQNPEILRSDLANLYLQLANLGFNGLKTLHWLDTPTPKQEAKAVKTLIELGALTEEKEVTPLGWKILRFQLPVRLGRVLVEAFRLGCGEEMIPIVSALNVPHLFFQPIKQTENRPLAWKHWLNLRSEMVSYYNLWVQLLENTENFPQSALKKIANQHQLSFQKLLEWKEQVFLIRKQCARIKSLKKKDHPTPLLFPLPYPVQKAIHCSLLSGFVRFLITQHPEKKGVYCNLERKEGFLARESLLANQKADWLLSFSMVETRVLTFRDLFVVEPRWILKQAKSWVKTTINEVFYDPKRDQVVAKINQSLAGFLVVRNKEEDYSKIDRLAASQVFVNEVLLTAPFAEELEFAEKNYRKGLKIRDVIIGLRLHYGLPGEDLLRNFYLEKLHLPCSIQNVRVQIAKKNQDFLFPNENWDQYFPSSWQDLAEKALRPFLPLDPMFWVDLLFPDYLWIADEAFLVEYSLDGNIENTQAEPDLKIMFYGNAFSKKHLQSWAKEFLIPGLVIHFAFEFLNFCQKALKQHFPKDQVWQKELLQKLWAEYFSAWKEKKQPLPFLPWLQNLLLQHHYHPDLPQIFSKWSNFSFPLLLIEDQPKDYPLFRSFLPPKKNNPAEQNFLKPVLVSEMQQAFPLVQEIFYPCFSHIPIWQYLALKKEQTTKQGQAEIHRVGFFNREQAEQSSLQAFMFFIDQHYSYDFGFLLQRWGQKKNLWFQRLNNLFLLLQTSVAKSNPKADGGDKNPRPWGQKEQKVVFEFAPNSPLKKQEERKKFLPPPEKQEKIDETTMLHWFQNIYFASENLFSLDRTSLPAQEKNWELVLKQANDWPEQLIRGFEVLWDCTKQQAEENFQKKIGGEKKEEIFSALFFPLPKTSREDCFGLSALFLERLVVYQKSYEKRREKFFSHPEGILAKMPEIAPWQELWSRCSLQWNHFSFRAKLVAKDYWLHFEEFKLSVFTQELKPIFKISAERMKKMNWHQRLGLD